MIDRISELFASHGNIIDLCLLNALIAYALFLALSANLFSLATGGFMAIGAYCSIYLTMEMGMPFSLAIAAGAIAAAVAAALIGAPVLRLRGDYFMLATFAFTEVIRVIALNWESVTGGAIGIVNIPRYTQTWQLALAVLLMIYVVSTLRGSYIGRAIAAIKQDDVVAQAMGVNVFSHRLSLFIASGFVSGVAGAFAGHLNYFVGPTDFGLARSVDALTYPILGGVNSLAGPIVGAIFTTVLPEALRFSSQLREILMGVLVVAIVLYLPGGAMSLFKIQWKPRRLVSGRSSSSGIQA